MRDAVEWLRRKNTAPGPDGIHAKTWALALEVLSVELRHIFNECLREGCFPPVWKEASLVLIPRPGRDAESPSAYRPIFLLGEAGKMLEYIVASRLTQHLEGDGPNLVEDQFGFRRGRSTIDAIRHIRSLVGATVSRGGVNVAVSLDISNAFNSLPWNAIREALIYHWVPAYLRAIIGDYLRDRHIAYPGRYGKWQRRAVHRGVSFWGPSCGTSRMTGSSAFDPWACAWFVTLTTPWCWPMGGIGMRRGDARHSAPTSL